MRIGLTGQSGSGKSTVSRIFAENGFYVIDADKVARDVVEKGQPALDEIAATFGREYLNEDGTLARRKLGSLVFADRAKLDTLQDILFPHILERIEMLAQGHEYVLIDAPTLFEAGCDKSCDAVVGVTASDDIRLARIMERDGISSEEAEKRFSSQHTADYFRERCRYIITNDTTVDELEKQARRLIEILMI